MYNIIIYVRLINLMFGYQLLIILGITNRNPNQAPPQLKALTIASD